MRPERFDLFRSRLVRRLRGSGAIVFALLAALASPGWATQSKPPTSENPTYSPQSFAAELQRLKTGLDSARKSTETLRAYRESLPASWSVTEGDRHYQVPTGLLESRLVRAEAEPKQRDQQLDRASDYLDALAAEASSASGGAPADTDSARSKLNSILARPEYERTRRKSWWDNLREHIDEILGDILNRIFRRVGGQKSLGTVLLWIGVCAGAILIALWIFRQWVRATHGQEMALKEAAVPSRSWQEWIFAARQAADRADYRVAIHCAYWAGIARLQDIGSLAPDRAKTPREYLRALAKSKLPLPGTPSSTHQALSTLTSQLEKTWYGYQFATEADFHDSLTQLENLGCHLL